MQLAVGHAMHQAGVPRFGVCAFAELPALLHCRATARLPKDAKSIVVCLFPYYTGEFSGRNLARYAIVDDYHTVTRAILARAAALLQEQFPNHSFEPFVDSSPIPEVFAAHRAGLGWVGRNGQLVAPGCGSYCFIGELVTNLPLAPCAAPLPSRCGDCRLCVDACPGGALSAGGAVELARCRSHITQKKGELAPWERDTIRAGGLAWGCDCCTDVCPYNRQAARTPLPAYQTAIEPVLTMDNVRKLCKTRAFGYRGAAVLERNLAILQQCNHTKESTE